MLAQVAQQKSVIRWTDCPDITIVVDWAVTKKGIWSCEKVSPAISLYQVTTEFH